jgi:hypothetical protein
LTDERFNPTDNFRIRCFELDSIDVVAGHIAFVVPGSDPSPTKPSGRFAGRKTLSNDVDFAKGRAATRSRTPQCAGWHGSGDTRVANDVDDPRPIEKLQANRAPMACSRFYSKHGSIHT